MAHSTVVLVHGETAIAAAAPPVTLVVLGTPRDR